MGLDHLRASRKDRAWDHDAGEVVVTAEAIVAPTDSQLRLIAKLCRERGYERPAAIHSMREASECITAMLQGRYDPGTVRARRRSTGGFAAMSHEWNCRCPRCESERRWLDGDDEAEAHDAERDALRYGPHAARLPDAD